MTDPALIKVSPHFTLLEVTHSDIALKLGVNNTPPIEELITCVRTAQEMEKVRALLNAPISVNSWFRSEIVNTSLGSKSTSQHRVGEAIDFTCAEYGNPFRVCRRIMDSALQFDQLILEHTWVHISFAIRSQVPKRQVLSLLANGSYSSGLTDRLGNKLI